MGVNTLSLMAEFCGLFSPTVGTAHMSSYEIELADIPPVRSPPYRCASPKHEIFQHIVIQLLEQGVVRVSKPRTQVLRYLSPKVRTPSVCW